MDKLRNFYRSASSPSILLMTDRHVDRSGRKLCLAGSNYTVRYIYLIITQVRTTNARAVYQSHLPLLCVLILLLRPLSFHSLLKSSIRSYQIKNLNPLSTASPGNPLSSALLFLSLSSLSMSSIPAACIAKNRGEEDGHEGCYAIYDHWDDESGGVGVWVGVRECEMSV